MSKLKENGQSTINIIEDMLKNNQEGKNIYELLEEVSKELDLDTEDSNAMNEIYMELTMSGRFVYVGNEKWALKKDNLEYWDKDGYTYGEHSEVNEYFEDEEDHDFSEFSLDDLDFDEDQDDLNDLEDLDEDEIEKIDDVDPEEKEYVDVGIDLKSTDDDDTLDSLDLDDDIEEDYDDEDDYNEIMDDYEDMYD